MVTAGEEEGGGEGNREAPPLTETWAAAWPPGADTGADAEVEDDTRAAVGWAVGYSAAESERCARGVVECRDRLTER